MWSGRNCRNRAARKLSSGSSERRSPSPSSINTSLLFLYGGLGKRNMAHCCHLSLSSPSLTPFLLLDSKKNWKSSYPLWYFLVNTQSFMIFLIVENEPGIKLLHQKEGPHVAEDSMRGELKPFGQWWWTDNCSMTVMFQVLVHHSQSPWCSWDYIYDQWIKMSKLCYVSAMSFLKMLYCWRVRQAVLQDCWPVWQMFSRWRLPLRREPWPPCIFPGLIVSFFLFFRKPSILVFSGFRKIFN